VASAAPVGLGLSVFQSIFESSPEAIALTRVRDGVLVQVNGETPAVHDGLHRVTKPCGRSAVDLGQSAGPAGAGPGISAA